MSKTVAQTVEEPSPKGGHTFIQWKGTNVCLDLNCACGAQSHFDDYFAYQIKCSHCGAVWEMPCVFGLLNGDSERPYLEESR